MVFFTLFFGFIYPALVTTVAQIFFHQEANGSILLCENKPCGSKFIAQNFKTERYFHSRPSAIDRNLGVSGATHFAPISIKLKEQIEQNVMKVGENRFNSGSGLDPHLSLEALDEQLPRVAKARHLSISTIRKIIDEMREEKDLGLLGRERVNVFLLNKKLDQQ